MKDSFIKIAIITLSLIVVTGAILAAFNVHIGNFHNYINL